MKVNLRSNVGTMIVNSSCRGLKPRFCYILILHQLNCDTPRNVLYMNQRRGGGVTFLLLEGILKGSH